MLLVNYHQYKIPKILNKIKGKANDEVKETIQCLSENGILTGNARKLVVRILVRHLYFKIAKLEYLYFYFFFSLKGS